MQGQRGVFKNANFAPFISRSMVWFQRLAPKTANREAISSTVLRAASD